MFAARLQSAPTRTCPMLRNWRWWQSSANLSPASYSLLHGKGCAFRTVNQTVTVKFPIQKNRELVRDNSEFPGRIRDATRPPVDANWRQTAELYPSLGCFELGALPEHCAQEGDQPGLPLAVPASRGVARDFVNPSHAAGVARPHGVSTTLPASIESRISATSPRSPLRAAPFSGKE
jgi:hypothetical protein